MPQFMIGDFAPQLVWLAISFVIFYFLMSRVALPRITDVLEDRQSRIADDLDQAEQLKGNAEQVIADYETALADARVKAQAMLAQTTSEANAVAEKRNAEVTERIGNEAAAAAARIADAKTAAMAEVKTVATELAQAAAEKLIGESVGEAEASAAVGAAIEEAN
jgi:F-type H+-transporting ATPase subunit b